MNPTSGMYRFTGEDGSLGFRAGQVYRLLIIEHVSDGRLFIVAPRPCPYGSASAFWENWEWVVAD